MEENDVRLCSLMRWRRSCDKGQYFAITLALQLRGLSEVELGVEVSRCLFGIFSKVMEVPMILPP